MARKTVGVIRTPADRAAYAELMTLLDQVAGARLRERLASFVALYVQFCAGRARAILEAALSDPATAPEDRAEIARILVEHPKPPSPKETLQ